MKKILFVATEPDAGMVTFASSIINSFHEAGYEVWALTCSKPNCPYTTAVKIGDRHIALDYPTKGIDKLMHKVWPSMLYGKIRDIADRNGIENIHFLTGEHGFSFYYSSVLNKRYNLIYTVHDLEAHPGASKKITRAKLFKDFFHGCTLRNLRKIDNIATCSRTQAAKIKSMYPSKKVVCHQFPSLVTDIIANGTEHCPELEGVEKYILFFGYVGYHKGIHVLYNAFLDSSLPTEGYRLVIAGRGGYYFERRPDESIIRINRFIKDEELASLYSNAAFIVYPYMQATMSGVLTIAQHFHKRAITSDLPYFQDNVTINDMMSRRDDVCDLKEKMECMAHENKEYVIVEDDKLFVKQLDEIYK